MDGLKSCVTDAEVDICSQSCSQAIPRNHYLTVIVTVLKLLIVAQHKKLLLKISPTYFTYFKRNQDAFQCLLTLFPPSNG